MLALALMAIYRECADIDMEGFRNSQNCRRERKGTSKPVRAECADVGIRGGDDSPQSLQAL